MEDRAGDRHLDRERQRQHYQEGVVKGVAVFGCAIGLIVIFHSLTIGVAQQSMVRQIQQQEAR